jgi:hypothetical protein
VPKADRLMRVAASGMAVLTAVSIWLSAGTIAVLSGDTHRVAALPSIWILIALAIAAVFAAQLAKLRRDESWPLLVTGLLWLPFVPGSVPAAFLIWQGPVEGVVWLIAIAGVMATRAPKVLPILVNPDRAPWIAGTIVALGALAVFSGIRGVIPGGDEPHYLAATQSILRDFDLRVANNYANGDYLDYFPGRLEPHFLKRSTSGEIYSIHAPGVSVVVLPAFAIAGYGGAVLTIIAIAAVTAAITWRIAWRVSGSSTGAWAGVAAVFATSPYLFHAFTIYPEIIGSLCVACGVWLLIDLADLSPAASAKGDARGVSQISLIATGAALALLPWLHSRFAVIAAALGLAIVLRLAARASAATCIAAFLSVPIAAGIAWFGFFWVIWGSPSPIAPYGADTSTSSSYIMRGVIGLLVDQQFGLLTTAPIYLVAIAGMAILARQRPRLAVELLLVVVPYTIAVASYAMWWAGAAAPARFLVAILPLAALPIALVFSRTKGTPVLTALLLVVSVALIAPRAFVESGRFTYNNRGAMDAMLEWLSQSVDLPLAVPGVHRDGGSIAMRDAFVWLAAIGGVYGAVAAPGKRTPAIRWAIGSAGLGIAVMIAATLVWRLHSSAAITPERSKPAAFGALRPWHVTLVDVNGLATIPRAQFLERLSFAVPASARRVNRVPAGDYRIVTNQAVHGAVTIFVGRTDPPIETPQADDLRDDRSSYLLRLPVAAQALNFRTGEAPADPPWLTLVPVGMRRPATTRNAVRATRYGHARVFFFDDRAYPEQDGFWTRGGGLATVVIDSADPTRLQGLPISITGGAVPTSISLTVGRWEETFDLAAGQKQDVTLPPASDGAWVVSIRSGPGFRPSEREPGSSDVRSLAAWIAIH